ncbi:hypothetical protein CG740_31690 [Streptomyces sp. CB01201]|uniref:hypothetical protein n=2 Tax=unclassified Streptomyces TaxID=2593676 RepID=UPI000C2783B0|nr:hypothetical protein [Streptomyces sp. CB01201]PJM99184.1 hypothetical protein CG740_31690 [Streptomyces sp. CB01201]
MANPDIQELNHRAAALRSLADLVESLMDAPRTHSVTTMKSWAGPNATDVRGKLNSWRTTCSTVAHSLRAEAQQAARDAKDLQNPKK